MRPLKRGLGVAVNKWLLAKMGRNRCGAVRCALRWLVREAGTQRGLSKPGPHGCSVKEPSSPKVPRLLEDVANCPERSYDDLVHVVVAHSGEYGER